jgi:hypothetical protein
MAAPLIMAVLMRPILAMLRFGRLDAVGSTCVMFLVAGKLYFWCELMLCVCCFEDVFVLPIRLMLML